MPFRIRFWGTRGSIPSPGPHTVRYGGNTPCVELRTDAGEVVVLDAGTGIRELGRSLLERGNGAPLHVDLFLSHAHWDHVQGIPYFQPAFREGARLTIWLAGPPHDVLERVLREQMAPAVFPVGFDDLPATIEFRSLDGVGSGRSYVVEALPVRHPGGALAYRFLDAPAGAERGAPSLVYVSDNELEPRASEGASAPLVDFARAARVLVHDATYTDEEYERHRGWGHSTDRAALHLALAAGVRTLVLYHHAPGRSDEEIDAMLERCRREADGRVEVLAAYEGLELSC